MSLWACGGGGTLICFFIDWAIIIKLTKKTRRRAWRGRDCWEDGIGEGGCEGIILCLSLTKETCRITISPLVALLNYMTIRELCYTFEAFSHAGIFRRVFSILKVHKIENFFGSKFEFCTISLLVLLKY